MFTNTPPPLHAPQAAARLNKGARTFIIYFYSFLCFTRFPLRVSLSLYTFFSTRLFLRVSLYTSLSMRLPFYIREVRAEARAETRVEA